MSLDNVSLRLVIFHLDIFINIPISDSQVILENGETALRSLKLHCAKLP